MANFSIYNGTTFADWISYGQTVTDDILIPTLLITVYLIMFIYLKSSERGTFETAMYCGFATLMIAGMFWLMGLTKTYYLYICAASIVLPIAFRRYA